MTCTYNHIQKNWETPFEEPVTFLCGNLALCEGHLYTRTAVKPREEYSLEPCTSDDLRALMTDGLNPAPSSSPAPTPRRWTGSAVRWRPT